MVFSSSSDLRGEIFLSKNASSPSLSGTRISVFFLNVTSASFSLISAISNLTAFDPISIAAYLNVLFLIFQIGISIDLCSILRFKLVFLVTIIVQLIDFPGLSIIF